MGQFNFAVFNTPEIFLATNIYSYRLEQRQHEVPYDLSEKVFQVENITAWEQQVNTNNHIFIHAIKTLN